MLLLLLLLTLSNIINAEAIDFNTWTITSGSNHVRIPSPNSLMLSFTNVDQTPVGASISSIPQLEGTFCLNPLPALTSGVITTMRLETGEAGNTHQFDFQWLYPNLLNDEAWIDLWGEGKNLIPVRQNSVAITQNSRYCMTWKIGESVFWYVNGIQVYKGSLAAFIKPVFPVISIWGIAPNSNDQGFLAFAGPNTLGTNMTTSSVSNAYLSTSQEVIGSVTTTTTLSPSFIPTTSPSISTHKVKTSAPSILPTIIPSLAQTTASTTKLTAMTTLQPSISPSRRPMVEPSSIPSLMPTVMSTSLSSVASSLAPTGMPSHTTSSSPIYLPVTLVPVAVKKSTESTLFPSIAPTGASTSDKGASASSSVSNSEIIYISTASGGAFLFVVVIVACCLMKGQRCDWVSKLNRSKRNKNTKASSMRQYKPSWSAIDV